MRRLIALLTAALVIGGATAGAAPAADAAVPTSAAAYRAQVLALTNAARSRARTCGGTRMPAVPALHADARLGAVASRYAGRMAREDFFSHTAPDGSTMSDRLQAAGFRGSIGENIAAGYPTPKAVVAGWLRSAGHCANLMSARYHRLGVGYATSSSATYGSYWVQDFAS